MIWVRWCPLASSHNVTPFAIAAATMTLVSRPPSCLLVVDVTIAFTESVNDCKVREPVLPVFDGCRNVNKRQCAQMVVRAATETEAKPDVAKVGVDP